MLIGDIKSDSAGLLKCLVSSTDRSTEKERLLLIRVAFEVFLLSSPICQTLLRVWDPHFLHKPIV